MPEVDVVLFADDVCAFPKIGGLPGHENIIDAIREAGRWAIRWRLTWSLEKSECLLAGIVDQYSDLAGNFTFRTLFSYKNNI